MATSTDDKILDSFYTARAFFEQNKKIVYGVLTVIVILIAGSIIYINNKNANNEKAAVELAKIRPLYDGGSFQQAINGDSLGMSRGLKFVVDNYGSTETGETAKIMLANSYYNVRDFDNSMKYFKEYGGKNDLLKVASVAGEASVYEAKQDYINAAKTFEKAGKMNKDNAFNDQYLFYAMRNYFMANDKAKVEELSKEIKRDYPKSAYVNQMTRYTGI